MRLTIGVLLAVLFSPLAQADLIDEINDRGELRIAVQPDAAPYAYKEKDNEPLTGFDIELGQALANELGVRAEFIETPEGEVLPGVQDGKFDITVQKSGTGLDTALQASESFGRDKLMIPFQKDNPAFESALNNALQRIKDDGRLLKLEDKWLKDSVQNAAER
ncbi:MULTISPECIES: transporter substrate-binding domain-containing protein [Pseudomonas]|jgi:ABC-type amino acid transport substrate-binding protein|uniref:Amino acid ABC transporter substrate-binding protein n=1 Tax=Pseudomonas mosselii TaxID=78327 RepID=A0A5R8YKD3_9PSED|nr:transporter substrate-binding domain-containing protein [Pseudomonas mosselii]TLP53429.1 amino acid ABC transporter substrate-binding protein [Pseudomonas mosselii]